MKLAALALLAVSLLSLSVAAEPLTSSPVGLWKTIDDNTGKPRALVRITEQDGELRGTIEKIYFEPGEDPTPRCEKCSDARHNQPVVGMAFLSGLKKEPDALVWSGGEILDPDSGTVYRSKATLTQNGTRLEVRGYIGFALLGRTQIWQRAE